MELYGYSLAGTRAKGIRTAFDTLSNKEQAICEKRNAVCMNYGGVGAQEERSTLKDLIVLPEGSTASESEGSPQKAPDKLLRYLVDADVLGV